MNYFCFVMHIIFEHCLRINVLPGVRGVRHGILCMLMVSTAIIDFVALVFQRDAWRREYDERRSANEDRSEGQKVAQLGIQRD